MKKDKFEKLLHDKLVDVKMPPPEDVWKKLEGGLAALRRENAFAAEGHAGKQGTGRPNRQYRSWIYFAASVCAAGLLIWALTRSERASDIDNSVADNVIAPEDDRPQRGVIGDISYPEPGKAPSSVDLEKVVPGKFTSRDTDGGEFEQVSLVSIDDDYVTEEKKTKDTDSEIAQASRGEQKNNAGKSDSRSYTGKTSDMKEHGGFAAQPFANAEYGRRSRRAAHVTTSLYAVNTGGIAGGGDVKGGTVMSTSGLVIDERSDFQDLVYRAGSTVTKKLEHDLPLTFGVNVAVGLSDKLSVQTGVTYTYMRSEAESGGDWDYSVKQELHYVGIPLSLKYDLASGRHMGFYVSAGGALEKCVSAKQSVKVSNADYTSDTDVTSLKVKGLQASVCANVGAEFNIDRTFAVYVEPGIGYFFKNSKQPESYRTENPLGFTLSAGLRVKL